MLVIYSIDQKLIGSVNTSKNGQKYSVYDTFGYLVTTNKKPISRTIGTISLWTLSLGAAVGFGYLMSGQ